MHGDSPARLQAARALYLQIIRPLAAVLAAVFLLSGALGSARLYERMSDAADAMAVGVSSELSVAEKQCFMLASLSTVASLLPRSNPSLDGWIQLDRDLELFAASPGVSGAEVFYLRSGKALMGNAGLVPLEEYPDQAFLSALTASAAPSGRVARSYRKTAYVSAVPVVSFFYSLPLYETGAKGYAVVDYSLSALAERAQAARAALPGQCRAMVDGRIVWSSGGAEDAPGLVTARSQAEPSSGAEAVYSMPLALFLWIALKPLHWLAAAAIAAAVAWPVARFVSRKMHAPVRALAERFAAQYLDDAADPTLVGEEDLLYQAFDSLAEQLRHAERTMRESEPLLREQVTARLLFSATPPADLEKELAAARMRLPYPYYAVVLLDLASGSLDGRAGLALRRSAEDILGSLGQVYSTAGEGGTVAFLCNCAEAEDLPERITTLCRTLQSVAESSFGCTPGFALSVCSREEPSLYNAYLQARASLPLTRGVPGDEEAMAVSSQARYAPMVDEETIRSISDAILSRDADLLAARMDRARSFFPERLPLPLARRIASSFCCALYCRLADLSGDIELTPLAGALRRIAQAEESGECAAQARAWALSLCPVKEEARGSAAYVEKARAFIEEHYADCPGVPAIAEAVYLNPVYLNRIFREATGATLSETLNAVRVERSLPLLEQGLPVAEIATSVGFSEARVYIRHFKKIHGVTPGEYRRGLA